MTKRVTRPDKKTGRPRKDPPPNAAARIEALAATGHSMVGIARGLNTSKDIVRRWCEDDPALAEALARGREAERFALHDVLFRAATEDGNIVAAMFLLKARHGYKEGDPSGEANRVSITFALPGAMSMEEFQVIDNEPNNRTERLSTQIPPVAREG
jgi:hypothetical protein